MRVWLLNPYGPIPEEGWRPYRFALLGSALADRGHEVIWWTANFSHHFKRFRSQSWSDRTVRPGFTIRLVPSASYTRNISLRRLAFEVSYAWNLQRRAVREAAPACIVGTDPSQIVGRASVRLARRHGAVLILDIFDMWPELFALALPRPLRQLAPILFSPFALLRRRNLCAAVGITALCDTYLDLAKREAPALRASAFLTIFNGIDVEAFRRIADGSAPRVGESQVPKKPANEVWAIFAGTLGNNYDIQTLAEAARLLQGRQANIRIWLAGEGPLRVWACEFIRAQRLTSLSYIGKLAPGPLIEYYKACDIGICAYGPGSNVAMPDKAYDYMAAGLAIVNSLPGELASVVQSHGIGLQYEAGDPRSLAEALEHLATDNNQRKAMAGKAYELAGNFDARRQYTRFAEFIENLVSSSGAA